MPDVPDVVRNGEGGQFESPYQGQNNNYYDDRAPTRNDNRPDTGIGSSKSFKDDNPQQKRKSTMRGGQKESPIQKSRDKNK